MKYRRKITGGTYWGQATLVIDTQSLRMSSELSLRTKPGDDYWYDLGKIQLQIHHPLELAQILHGAHQVRKDGSIKLKAGHEYTIRITPITQNITDRFRSLPKEIRKCVLPHEIPENSFMKVYNAINCRYECNITSHLPLKHGNLRHRATVGEVMSFTFSNVLQV